MTEEAALLRLSALCAAAEHCVGDVRRKLAAWELPEGAADRVVERLLRERFVDEGRYARAFVRDKFRHNRWGARKIAYELRARGVPEADIDGALAEIPPEDAERTLAALLRQKLRTTRGKSDYDVLLKLLRFAVARGFSQDEARRCLRRIVAEEGGDCG